MFWVSSTHKPYVDLQEAAVAAVISSQNSSGMKLTYNFFTKSHNPKTQRFHPDRLSSALIPPGSDSAFTPSHHASLRAGVCC